MPPLMGTSLLTKLSALLLESPSYCKFFLSLNNNRLSLIITSRTGPGFALQQTPEAWTTVHSKPLPLALRYSQVSPSPAHLAPGLSLGSDHSHWPVQPSRWMQRKPDSPPQEPTAEASTRRRGPCPQ